MKLSEFILQDKSLSDYAETLSRTKSISREDAATAIFIEYMGAVLSPRSQEILREEKSGRIAITQVANMEHTEGLDGQDLINKVDSAIINSADPFYELRN